MRGNRPVYQKRVELDNGPELEDSQGKKRKSINIRPNLNIKVVIYILQRYQYLHHAYLQITKSKYDGIEDLQMATGYWDQEICDLVNHIIVGGT